MLASSRSARDRALRRGGSVAVRDWFLVELSLGSGLRVSELAGLTCADLPLGDPAAVVVRHGKGNRSRVVNVSSKLRATAEKFVAWKRARGEDVGPHAPVFLSCVTGRAMSARALQDCFARALRRASVAHKGIHSARHTYATALFRSSRNLRLVQRQLGHASLATTQIYLSLFDEDVIEAVEGLYSDVDGVAVAAPNTPRPASIPQ